MILQFINININIKMDSKFDNTIIIPSELVESIGIIIKYQNKQLEKEVMKMID
jgi:hypothetical protein